MIETSRDVLNLTISFCVVWVAVFFCWVMYYAKSIMKKIDDSLNLFNIVMTSLNSFIGNTKEKIQNSISNFQIVGLLVKRIIEEIDNRKSKTKSTSRTKKK